MRKSVIPLVLLYAAFVNPSIAQLVDNGDGTISDLGKGIMWTSNANLPGSASRTFNEAVSWVANLNYAGHTDWRLPRGTDPRSDPFRQSPDGQYFYNCRQSEFGNLFYNVLGGCSGWSIDIMCVGFSTQPNTDPDLALFDNILGASSNARIFWTDIHYDATRTWTFSFHNGSYRAVASDAASTYRRRTWAVRNITQQVSVPDLRHMTEGEAESRLATHGLVKGAVTNSSI